MKKKKIFSRYTALFLIMLLLFAAIVTRLFFLQIVSAEEYIDIVNTKSVRYLTEPAPRGEITDRNGALLATNKPSYNLVFIDTDESRKYFFDTFKKVFQILNERTKINDKGEVEKEKFYDDFELKLDPFRFEFQNADPKARRIDELRFKKDRGFDYKLASRLYKSNITSLTEEETELIAEEVLNITAEEVFYDLVCQYELYKLLGLSKDEEKKLLRENNSREITQMLLEKYPLEELRKFMIVRDTAKMNSFSKYEPVVIASNIDRSTAFIFEQLKNTLPGIDITLQPIRYYPYKELGSNFLGYISKISADKSERLSERGYDVNTDYIGVAGLESAFEDRLKGSKGSTTVRVNKLGRKTEELFKLEPYQGQNIKLTIDKNLQYVAERALNDTMVDLQIHNTHGNDPVNTANATRGAAVVLDVNTGAVLAMASNPGFDPNLFTVPGRLTPELYQQYFVPDLTAFGEQYIKDKNLDRRKVSVDTLFPIDQSIKGGNVRKDYYDIYPKPFFNYATSSLIPPGSTFKPLTGIAGMEEGVITRDTRIMDAQIFDEHGKDTENYGGACWIWNEYRDSHGRIDVTEALEKSCNYFFYEVGWRLYNKSGLNTLAKYAWRFGLGVDPNSNVNPATGLEIFENFGQVYNQQSRRNVGAANGIIGVETLLKSGKYIPGNGGRVIFTPLNIGNYAEDSEGLKLAKKELRDAITNNIKKEEFYGKSNIQYLNFKVELQPLFKKVIANLPDEVKKQYKDSDIEGMAEAVSTYVTFDIKTTVITPGNIYDASIGQGINNFTPVQLANYIATFVNGGNRYKVHLVDKFLDPGNNIIEDIKPEIIEKVSLKSETIKTIKEGMRKVTDESGTAAGAFEDFNTIIETGGKTGSATSIANQEMYGRTSYGLYLGFAPFDKPEIAVCVVIFDGGHGGYVAPVARAVYETYFREILKNTPNFKPMFDYTLNPEQ